MQIAFKKCEKIEFLPNYINPANAPKLRPIEDFWGILKQIVDSLKKIDPKVVLKFESVYIRIYKFRRYDALFFFHFKID